MIEPKDNGSQTYGLHDATAHPLDENQEGQQNKTGDFRRVNNKSTAASGEDTKTNLQSTISASEEPRNVTKEPENLIAQVCVSTLEPESVGRNAQTIERQQQPLANCESSAQKQQRADALTSIFKCNNNRDVNLDVGWGTEGYNSITSLDNKDSVTTTRHDISSGLTERENIQILEDPTEPKDMSSSMQLERNQSLEASKSESDPNSPLRNISIGTDYWNNSARRENMRAPVEVRDICESYANLTDQMACDKTKPMERPQLLMAIKQLMQRRDDIKSMDKHLTDLMIEYIVQLNSMNDLGQTPNDFKQIFQQESAQWQGKDSILDLTSKSPISNGPSVNLKKSRLLGNRKINSFAGSHLGNKSNPQVTQQAYDSTTGLTSNDDMVIQLKRYELQQQLLRFQEPTTALMALELPQILPIPSVGMIEAYEYNLSVNNLKHDQKSSHRMDSSSYDNIMTKKFRGTQYPSLESSRTTMISNFNNELPQNIQLAEYEIHETAKIQGDRNGLFSMSQKGRMNSLQHETSIYGAHKQQNPNDVSQMPMVTIPSDSPDRATAYILATRNHNNLPTNNFNCNQNIDIENPSDIHHVTITPAKLTTQNTFELVRATIGKDHQLVSVAQKMSFRCHVCNSCFEDRHRLQQHLSIHLNLHPSWFEEKTIKETMAQYESRRGDYLCTICSLRFETTAEFDKHMQLHGEKPHHCELCAQDNKHASFRYYRQLLTHLRSHCLLYSCKFAPDCRQTANRKDYLKLHILKHHLKNKLPEQYTICSH